MEKLFSVKYYKIDEVFQYHAHTIELLLYNILYQYRRALVYNLKNLKRLVSNKSN